MALSVHTLQKLWFVVDLRFAPSSTTTRSILGVGLINAPLIIESIVESIDIDTQEDFDMAEFYLKSIKLKSSLL